MIGILIVSDIRLYREGLAESLKSRAGFVVVGTATRSDGAIRQAAELSPGVILVDHALPDSLQTVRLISDRHPDIKLIALGVLEREQDVLAFAEAGVAGYVPREASLDDLIAAIESTDRGELRCSPKIAATLLRQLARRAGSWSELPPRSPLTSREAEIVRLIEQDLSNKEIATRLGIQVATVKNHVHNLLEKLRVHHRAEAAGRLRGWAPRRPASGGLRAMQD